MASNHYLVLVNRMRILNRYKHGLKYNTKTSQYMVFGINHKNVNVLPIRLNGGPRDRVQQFHNLRRLLTSDLNDNADIERERKASSVRVNMFTRRFASRQFSCS